MGHRHRGGKFFGVILLVLGLLWLLEVAGVLTGSFFRYLWPILVLVVGFSLLLKGSGRDGGSAIPPSPPPAT